MAYYRYTARDRTGKKRTAQIIGGSRREVALELREKGLAVLEIKEIEESFLHKEIHIGNPVRSQDFVIYLRQFSTLLTAGVSIVDATRILARQTESKALKKALLQIEEDLRAGIPFSKAAAKHNKIFPMMVINLVKAGEISGHLDESLDRLAFYFEKQHYTKKKVESALAYPAILGIVAIGVVIFLLTSVVPTFANMFSGFGAELPAITQFVLHLSEWMKDFWMYIFLFVFLLISSIILLKRNISSKYYIDYAILKIPIIGKIIQKGIIARMTRTLSSLFASSVPVLQAVSIVEKVVENEVMGRVLRASRASLEEGRPLSEPMNNHWIFPPLVIQMIAIGEQSGALDAMLGKIAEFYEQEVESATDQLRSLIEPIMIVFLAVIVGTIVTSIMVPMFEIFNHVG